ncbi:MAG: N-methyl-L-tryptophan oxidase [Ktedonobacterales bacterium]
MAHPNVIVVGGGVMGLATASALAGRGAEVTVLERYSIAHSWASSHGLSRAIRHEYGPQSIYSEMVVRSRTLWNRLADETNRQLYTETGVLTLGYTGDGWTSQGYEVMRSIGLPVELLTYDDCQRRFPQFNTREYDCITYNPTGGYLAATECVEALAWLLAARGGQLRQGVRVKRVESRGTGGRVVLDTGDMLDADRVVVTAGPWVHDVLPSYILPVRATRQQVCYLHAPAEPQLSLGNFPIFLAAMEYYGFPVHGAQLFKVGLHKFGAEVDPNEPYSPSMDEVEQVRAFLQTVIPSAAALPFAMADLCMYDVTPDEDFILDHLPEAPGVIVGSGFSGHGFKFGVLIGELLAALALDEDPEFPLDLFRLGRFS